LITGKEPPTLVVRDALDYYFATENLVLWNKTDMSSAFESTRKSDWQRI
jgi:hypothetical protein